METGRDAGRLMICSERRKSLISELCLICSRIKGTNTMSRDERWPGNPVPQLPGMPGCKGLLNQGGGHSLQP